MKKTTALALLWVLLLLLSGCAGEETSVPEDFAFSLTWNCYGISSYDSRTGTLVKTTDTASPEDYLTEYRLSEEDRIFFYDLITSLDPGSYPEEYDPQNGMSKPSMTLILTVYQQGSEKTVRAENIGLSFTSADEKGQRFLSVCKAISDRLTATDAWKALPDYEHFYQ